MLMTGLLARFPAHNGDLPFYIAAAYSAQGFSDSASLAAAATEIAASLPAEEAALPLQNLGAAPPRFLDFYRVKIGYTGTVVLLHRLGFSYVDATVIPSLIAFFLLGWTVFSWCARVFAGPPLLLFWLFLPAATGMLQLGRISTPDPVSQFLLFQAIYRIRFSQSAAPTLIFLFLALFFRVDNLPAVLGLICLMGLVTAGAGGGSGARPSLVALLSLLAGAMACCALINAWSEPRFWWFRPVPYPGVVQAPERQLGIRFLLGLAGGPLPVLLALTAVYSRFGAASRTTTSLLIFLGLMFPVRYLLFPHYEDRFFVAFYLAGFCVLLDELAGNGVRRSASGARG